MYKSKSGGVSWYSLENAFGYWILATRNLYQAVIARKEAICKYLTNKSSLRSYQ